MFFAVGIGNTNTAVGLIDGRKIFVERKPTETLQTAGDFKNLFEAALSRFGPGAGKPEGSILASVVPGLTKPSVNALSGFTGAEPLLADTRIHTELDFSGYRGLLGSDRIAVCAAAWNRYKAPCIAVDMGTATTFNVVGPNAVFLGGAILPGLRMGLEALNRNTAQLPGIDLKGPSGVIGRDTEECLLVGACYGTAAMVDGLIERMTGSLHQETKVILTGGSATSVLPFMKTQADYEPDLLLEGLAVLYRKSNHISGTGENSI